MKKVIRLGGCSVAIEVLNQVVGVTVAKSVFVFTEHATLAEAAQLQEVLAEAIRELAKGVQHG